MPAQTRKFLEERAARDPELELLETNISFPNPYVLRNLALARIRTRYAMFLFNDVVPQNERWLAELHRCAEERPEADIFQPFIWEGVEAPHAAWSSIQFVRRGPELHCVQPIRAMRGGHATPDALPEREQPYFLEDHAFLARTAFLASQSIMDPGAAYAKEFLDMALSMRFRGSRIWAVPASQVLYAVPYQMQPGDLLYFSYRRSWSVSRGSIEYIRKKWGFSYRDDAYSVTFTRMQLESATWTGDEIPPSRREQVEMMLGTFTAMGFDRFEVLQDGASAGAAPTALPDAHRRLEEALRRSDSRIGWAMRHTRAVDGFPDFTADFAARREAVRAGGLFPVVPAPQADAAVAETEDRFPRRFVAVELEGIRGSETDVIEALKGHASLLVRERDADGNPVFRAWLHGVAQARSDIRQLAVAITESNRRGIRIAQKPLAGATMRLHDVRGADALPVRVFADPSAEGWRLLHCAWKPAKILDLAALLH